jgi:hypothetical protein
MGIKRNQGESMRRDKIFVSYSHEDAEYKDHLLRHMDRQGEKRTVSTWSDDDIITGEKWRKTIDEAIESTAIVVLLVSTNFLKSGFIRDVEMRRLLAARETLPKQLELTPIWVSPISEKREEWEFEIPLGRTQKTVDIREYQFINTQEESLSKYINQPHELDSILAKAVDQIYHLADTRLQNVEFERTVEFDDANFPVLIVELDVLDDRYIQRYFAANDRLIDEKSVIKTPISRDSTGVKLYKILFGETEDTLYQLLQEIKGGDSSIPLTPAHGPVRVQIRTNDPGLIAQPWKETSWNEEPLVKRGWTFEFQHPDIRRDRALHTLEIITPCRVLIFIPELVHFSNSIIEPHINTLQHCFDDAWNLVQDDILITRSSDEFKTFLHTKRPDIFYYFGASTEDKGDIRLLLGRDDESLTPGQIADLWSIPPKIVYINILNIEDTPLGEEFSQWTTRVPLVVLQHQDLQETKMAWQAPEDWFRWVFVEDQHPITALNRLPTSSVLAWSAFREWLCEADHAADRRSQVRLLLDRIRSKRHARGALDELDMRPALRVYALVVFGGPNDQVEMFPRQLLAYLQPLVHTSASIVRISLPLPLVDEGMDERTIDRFLHRNLRIGQDWHSWIKQIRDDAPGSRRSMLLLDFEPPKRDYLTTDQGRLLGAWANFCCHYIAESCPDSRDIIACLALQIAPEKSKAELKETIDELGYRLRKNRRFKLEYVPPLSHVKEKELYDFLTEEEEINCPSEKVEEVTENLYQKTSGRFNETADCLEFAVERGWERMLYMLETLSNDHPCKTK